jgi:hypothetical protein
MAVLQQNVALLLEYDCLGIGVHVSSFVVYHHWQQVFEVGGSVSRIHDCLSLMVRYHTSGWRIGVRMCNGDCKSTLCKWMEFAGWSCISWLMSTGPFTQRLVVKPVIFNELKFHQEFQAFQ